MAREPGHSIYDYDPDTGDVRSYGAWQTPADVPDPEGTNHTAESGHETDRDADAE